MKVFVERSSDGYEASSVDKIIERWDELFASCIRPGDRIVIKPNWISHSHKYKEARMGVSDYKPCSNHGGTENRSCDI